MRLLLLLGLSTYAAAAPSHDHDHEDGMVIIRCMAENFGDEKKILDCRNCFKTVGDYMSAGGLPRAKRCADMFWTDISRVCAGEIAKLTVGDYEQGDVVLECFDNALEKTNAERCMKETTSNDVMAKLTEGSMCILESHRDAWSYVKNVTGGHKKRRRGKKQSGWGQRKEKVGMKEEMMKLIAMAHCDVAIDEGDARNARCKSCFAAAAETMDIGRTRALATCSDQFLAPLYDECTAMMRDVSKEKKEVFGCYNMVLLGSLVKECANEEGVTTANAENLVKVTECGEDLVTDWVMDHAEPEVAEKIGHFFGMGSEEHD